MCECLAKQNVTGDRKYYGHGIFRYLCPDGNNVMELIDIVWAGEAAVWGNNKCT
jgi:hypothetical protein